LARERQRLEMIAEDGAISLNMRWMQHLVGFGGSGSEIVANEAV
jgi:hypothetical protein